jgi:hypothetical protein
VTTKTQIKSAIVGYVKGTAYSKWRIGLTHDLAERKAYWGENKRQDMSSWHNWTADSLADAQEIENYFINEKGMKGGVGGDLSARKTVYVYIL